jgi:hypothetical protein
MCKNFYISYVNKSEVEKKVGQKTEKVVPYIFQCQRRWATDGVLHEENIEEYALPNCSPVGYLWNIIVSLLKNTKNIYIHYICSHSSFLFAFPFCGSRFDFSVNCLKVYWNNL